MKYSSYPNYYLHQVDPEILLTSNDYEINKHNVYLDLVDMKAFNFLDLMKKFIYVMCHNFAIDLDWIVRWELDLELGKVSFDQNLVSTIHSRKFYGLNVQLVDDSVFFSFDFSLKRKFYLTKLDQLVINDLVKRFIIDKKKLAYRTKILANQLQGQLLNSRFDYFQLMQLVDECLVECCNKNQNNDCLENVPDEVYSNIINKYTIKIKSK